MALESWAGITEPMTLVTDYLLAGQMILYGLVFGRGRRGAEPARIGLWRAAFLVTAVAALAGGSAHGFRLYLGAVAHAWLWQATIYAIAVSAALTLGASLASVLRPRIGPGRRRKGGHQWMQWGLWLTLAGFGVLIFRLSLHRHFNHNDIYHLIQMGGLHCLYRGAQVLEGLRIEKGSDG